MIQFPCLSIMGWAYLLSGRVCSAEIIFFDDAYKPNTPFVFDGRVAFRWCASSLTGGSLMWIFIIFFMCPSVSASSGLPPWGETSTDIHQNLFFFFRGVFPHLLRVRFLTAFVWQIFRSIKQPWWDALTERERLRRVQRIAQEDIRIWENEWMNEARPLPPRCRFHALTDVHRRHRRLSGAFSDYDESKGRCGCRWQRLSTIKVTSVEFLSFMGSFIHGLLFLVSSFSLQFTTFQVKGLLMGSLLL